MRTAEPADATAIARLVNAAFRPERLFIDTDRTDPEKVDALLKKGKFLGDSDTSRMAPYPSRPIKSPKFLST